MRAVWVRCRAEASYSQGGCAHLRVVDVFRRFRHGRNGLRVPEGVRHMLLCAAPSRCLVVVGGLLAGHCEADLVSCRRLAATDVERA